MKLVKTVEAVGHVLCHDVTQIVPGVTKDAVFRKGHIITEEDLPVLLSIGKEHLYVWEYDETRYHEDEAAEVLGDICCNTYMTKSAIKEGKVEIIAEKDGLFKVDGTKLDALNALGDMIIATRHNNLPVKKGDKLAGARIIPLVIGKERMRLASRIAGQRPILGILPFHPVNVGIVTTGSEVFHKRIQDAFRPVIQEKLVEYGSNILGQAICDDKPEMIARAIMEFLGKKADMIICTGGMSVDPDDNTPAAIRETGAEIVAYGVPVLPGAMFLLAYASGGVPILGVPGCAIYYKRTSLDLILPRVIAGERLSAGDLQRLGAGGLCLNCKNCTFPNCGYGRGAAG